LFGGLSRNLLVQVQKGKVELQTALLSIDRILAANELTFALVAAIPSLLIALALSGTLLSSLFRLVFGVPFRTNRATSSTDSASVALLSSTHALRMAYVELDRALQQLTQAQILLGRDVEEADEEEEQDALLPERARQQRQRQRQVRELEGMYVFRVERMYRVAARLFLSSGANRELDLLLRPDPSSTSEWHNIQLDLLQLADPRVPLSARRDTAQRMARIYAVLRSS